VPRTGGTCHGQVQRNRGCARRDPALPHQRECPAASRRERRSSVGSG
jgi:hypothetical protein